MLNLRSKEPKIQQIQYKYHLHALLNKKTVYIYILRCGLNTHFSKLRLLIYCISISYRWIHCSSVPTFHLHSSVNSVGCHQDHFSTHVRVCSSRQEFYACQRIEFKNLRQLSAEQHLCHSLSTPIWKENAKEHVPVKHCDVCMCVCVCVCVFACSALSCGMCLVMFGLSLSQLWRDIEQPLISFTAMASASSVRPDQIYHT